MEKEKKQDKNQVVVIKTDHSGKENENVEYMAIPENDTPGGGRIIEAFFKKGKRVFFFLASWFFEFITYIIIEIRGWKASKELRKAMLEMAHVFYDAIRKGCNIKHLNRMLKEFKNELDNADNIQG